MTAMSKAHLGILVFVASTDRALVMLLAFSYQFLNIASWIVNICNPYIRLTGGPKGPKLDTQQLMLSLFFAAEFPLIASYHPMVLKDSLSELDVVPSDHQLFGQMLVFLIAEQLMHPFFMKFYSLYSTERPMDASGLATEFSIQQTALLVGIVLIQCSSGGDRAGSLLGELHILALAGWILLQKISHVSERCISGYMGRT